MENLTTDTFTSLTKENFACVVEEKKDAPEVKPEVYKIPGFTLLLDSKGSAVDLLVAANRPTTHQYDSAYMKSLFDREVIRTMSFKQRVAHFEKYAKDSLAVELVGKIARTPYDACKMHIAHMIAYNKYKTKPKNADANGLISWDYLSKADTPWYSNLWQVFLKSKDGRTPERKESKLAPPGNTGAPVAPGPAPASGSMPATGQTTKAENKFVYDPEPDETATRENAKTLLKNWGVGQEGAAMVATGVDGCVDPCKCGNSRSAHVMEEAIDYKGGTLPLLEAALKKYNWELDTFLELFGLYRPLMNLKDKDQEEYWHVEALKDSKVLACNFLAVKP